MKNHLVLGATILSLGMLLDNKSYAQDVMPSRPDPTVSRPRPQDTLLVTGVADVSGDYYSRKYLQVTDKNGVSRIIAHKYYNDKITNPDAVFAQRGDTVVLTMPEGIIAKNLTMERLRNSFVKSR